MSPSGDTVYASVAGTSGIYLYNRRTKTFLTYVPLPVPPFSIKLSPDRKQIFAAGNSSLCVGVDRAGPRDHIGLAHWWRAEASCIRPVRALCSHRG